MKKSDKTKLNITFKVLILRFFSSSFDIMLSLGEKFCEKKKKTDRKKNFKSRYAKQKMMFNILYET